MPTDSAQYYSNGLQGPHTKTQQSNKGGNSSITRNRDGSSASNGSRKVNQLQQQKAILGNYIRTSQNSKQIKQSTGSRNQMGIGGHLNSQVTKQGHRSINSGGVMLT